MTSPIDAAEALTPFWMRRIHEVRRLQITACRSMENESWTVFGHYKTGGMDVFGDFKTEAAATAFRDKLIKAYPHLASK